MPTSHDVTKGRSVSLKYNASKSAVHGQKATNRVPACNWSTDIQSNNAYQVT